MNHAVNLRHILTVGVLLASALNCGALSLGQTKGVVWIGQPMDVSVQVKLEPGEDASSLCMAADVFHADSRVNGNEVRVGFEAGVNRDALTVRIRSAALVDEPVVTVYLRAGCSKAMTRRYVFLAEVPNEYSLTPLVKSAGATGVGEAPSGSDSGASSTASPFSGGTIGKRSTQGDSVASVAPTKDTAGSASLSKTSRSFRAPPSVQSVVRKPKTEMDGGRPKLKLDPAELLIERDPVLRASAELLTTPSDAGSRRAEAAALWRAINATPEEILKDAQRLEALHSEVASLRSQSLKNEAAIAELKGRVQTAQAERYTNGLVWGLLAAMLLAVGAAGYLWTIGRKQANHHWWGSDDKVAGEQDDLADVAATGAQGLHVPVHGEALDVDLSSSGDTKHDEPTTPIKGLRTLDSVDFETSLPGTGRAVTVEELFDIQQQADFFVSLGQFDQAVATLRNHISDNNETSALAYLDLLKIFHLQGREQDYDMVRKEFNDVFNAEVPAFADFGQQTRGLEAYQAALSRIMALWPSAKVLGVIEESIFRKPGMGNQAFDLEAYRELLLLYAVAKEIVEKQDLGLEFETSEPGPIASFDLSAQATAAMTPPKFQATSIQPLPTAGDSADDMMMPMLRVPPSPNLGLDIDLSEFSSSAPVSPVASAPAAKGTTGSKPQDSNLVDFDLFDLATQAHAASKRGKT